MMWFHCPTFHGGVLKFFQARGGYGFCPTANSNSITLVEFFFNFIINILILLFFVGGGGGVYTSSPF